MRLPTSELILPYLVCLRASGVMEVLVPCALGEGAWLHRLCLGPLARRHARYAGTARAVVASRDECGRDVGGILPVMRCDARLWRLRAC